MTIKKNKKQLIIEIENLQQELASIKKLGRSPFSFTNIKNTIPHSLINESIDSINTKEYTIVLIEDSETDRIIYSRYLTHYGQNKYKIIEFDNGEDALAWCQQTIPDILLVDFLLPDMNGLEFLQCLYQQTNQDWIPAIIMTGQENIELAVTLLKNGAQDYLVKTHITPISLQQAIAKVLQQQKLIQEQIWQQQQQELVTNTALAIRNSFKLKDILQTAVTQVRQILQTDRVIIYQFQPDWSGIVTTESIAEPALSILGRIIKDNCFETSWVEQYRQGRIRAIDDIHTDANLAECHRKFLASFQIRADLVIPIIQGENLWGLLIAQQCYAPRHWTKAECEMMNQLAIQIGIAIQKAMLFEELQTQLEKYQQLVSIVENSSDFIATADFNGQVQYINPAGKCLLGLEDTDVQQTSIWEYQTPEWNQTFQQQIIPTVISTGRWEGEWQMLHFQTRELIPVWCNIFTLKNQITGQPHTIATVTRDIRERKQAEERLKQLNAELELRVVERTTQLVKANNKLQKELFQREKLERKLRQSEQLLEGFFQAASQVNIGLGIVDKNFYFLKVNQTLAQINGHTIAAHDGKSFGELLPEIASNLLPLLQNLIDTQQPISNLEISGILPSDPEVLHYWQLSYFPIIGELKETIAVGAIILDISERKSLEIEKARQIAILEATPDIIATARFDTQQSEYLNEASRKFFGVSEFDNITIVDVHPGWALKIIQEQAIPTALKNGIWVGETAFLRHDGQEIPVSQVVITHTFGKDQVQSISTIARDITAQKQLEAQLRESDRRWKSLQDNIQLIVIILDAQGHVEYANPFFLEITGYTQAEVVGKNWFENFLPDKLQDLIAVYQETLQKNIIIPHYQNEIITKSGEEKMINWNNTILNDVNSNPTGTISIGEDITERYKLERMKAEFVAIVSHELRTPLTSMQASLSLLHDKIIDPTSPEGEATIEIATDGVDHLVHLVNDILDLERLTSGKIRLEKHLCNTTDLINSAIAQMQSMAKQAGININITGEAYQIHADPNRLLQVIINLISNAIKFSDSGSTIWLSCNIYEQCANEESSSQFNSSACDSITNGQPCLVLTIKDRGRGIPSDYLNKIFEPFEQVDASDSRTKDGTGLGLAICRSIIQQHGGNIWVESILGQGSNFYFTLPIGEISSDQ